MSMTPAKLAALRALAEKATPGPWEWRNETLTRPGQTVPIAAAHLTTDERFPNSFGVKLSVLEQNAAYIAAVSPDVALELIAEVERLRAMSAQPAPAAGEPSEAEVEELAKWLWEYGAKQPSSFILSRALLDAGWRKVRP